MGGTETCFRLSHGRGTVLPHFQSLQDPLLSRPFIQKPRQHFLSPSDTHFTHLAPHHSGCPSLPFGCLSPPSDLLLFQFALRNSCQQPGLILSQDGSQQLLPER